MQSSRVWNKEEKVSYFTGRTVMLLEEENMNHKAQKVPFGTLDWLDDAPGIRAKEVQVEGKRWAIVEYAEGAWREEWCEEGHRGFVLEGEIEYEFDDGSEPLRARKGEAFLLPTAPLTRGAHRGRNLTPGSTRLFLIDGPTN